MNFVFLMDPMEKIKPQKDTSLLLMLGAHRRGHRIFYLLRGGINLKNGKVDFNVIRVIPQANPKKPFLLKERKIISENETDAVFIRTDPPFDQNYLMDCWLLERLPRHIPVINAPAGIRTVNEKIWATQFTSLIPKTVVSRRKEVLLNFLRKEKDIIAKPVDGHGGALVFHLVAGRENIDVSLEAVSRQYTKEIILQKFVPQARKGDKRILLLNGEPLGVILRVHKKGEHRNNFFAGGAAVKTIITANDRKIIRALQPELKKLGLYFVGIDIIGDFLIEVNVTSPTCMQEMNRAYRQHLEIPVIKFAEDLAKQRMS